MIVIFNSPFLQIEQQVCLLMHLETALLEGLGQNLEET